MPVEELVKAMQDQTKVLAQLVEQQGHRSKENGYHSKAALTAHTGTFLHGPGGLFNTPGLESAIFSTHVHAYGLGQLLRAFPTNQTHPWFGLITGFGGEVGSEPTDPCDDAPTGYIKSGTLTAKFGHVSRDTNTIRLPDTIVKLNRGDFTDLQLANAILNPESQGVYYPNDISEQGMLDMVTKAEQVIVGVNLERKLSNLLWAGDGTGAADTGDGYREFPGLASQVATGQVDAETNAAMASADSIVMTHNYGNVETVDIVRPLQLMERHLFQLAMDTQIAPVTWVLVMRPDLWERVSDVWPIQYNTQPTALAVAGAANERLRIMLDGRTNIDQRDAMRAGLYLDINGRRYNVVLDNMIPVEDNQSGVGLGMDEFASSIYFLPLTVRGMMPVLYWEYLDHQLSVPQTNLLRGMETWYSDGGRFLWSYDGIFTCFKLKAEVDPRVVLRTPWLAGVLQDVVWTSELPSRDPDPDSSYWKDGGVSLRNIAGPTRYAAWL